MCSSTSERSLWHHGWRLPRAWRFPKYLVYIYSTFGSPVTRSRIMWAVPELASLSLASIINQNICLWDITRAYPTTTRCQCVSPISTGLWHHNSPQQSNLFSGWNAEFAVSFRTVSDSPPRAISNQQGGRALFGIKSLNNAHHVNQCYLVLGTL